MRMLPAQARAISRGAKYQHRHPVDPRLLVTPLHAATRHSGRPFIAAVGDIVPVDSDHRTYCKVIAVSRGPLGTLTLEEAKAEGYETPDEFELAWVERHERLWLDRQIEYLIEQNVPRDEADDTRDAWAKVRYQHYWTGREVWLLEIVPFNDMPYLLPGLQNEPEAIPADRLNRGWGIKAERRRQEANLEEFRHREAKQLARRVKLMKLNNPDAPEIAVIEEQLQRLEQRYSEAA